MSPFRLHNPRVTLIALLLLQPVASTARAQPATPGTASPIAPEPRTTPLTGPSSTPLGARNCENPLVQLQLTETAPLATTDLFSATWFWHTQDFSAAHNDIAQCAPTKSKADHARLAALDRTLAELEESVAPNHYRVAFLQADACYNGGDVCDTRLAGFAQAARKRQDPSLSCWAALAALNGTPGPFRSGFADYWKAQDPQAECDRPPTPTRCLVAWCFGGLGDPYEYGLALRASIELGVPLGAGLGFSESTGGVTFQVSGSLGVRFFFFDDAWDVHGGLGIAGAAASSPRDTSAGSEDTSTSNEGHGFLVVSPGFGFWNGLFAVNYIHTFDPFTSLGSGNGVGIFVDATAVERVAE